MSREVHVPFYERLGVQFPRPTHRFGLSFRDVEDLLAERGITVSYETIRHSTGATIDFVLSGRRDAAAATRLFRKALTDPSHPQPRVINTNQARLYGSAIAGMKKEGILRRRCRHRPVQYLNNIVEQDHRAIKRRVKAKQGFREFQAARRTIQGYEAIHMIRKGQARWVSGKRAIGRVGRVPSHAATSNSLWRN